MEYRHYILCIVCTTLLFGCARTVVINRLPPVNDIENSSEVWLCRKNYFYGGVAATIFSLDGRPLFRSAAAKYTKFRVPLGKHTISLLMQGPAGPGIFEIGFAAEKSKSYYFTSSHDKLFEARQEDLDECINNNTSYEYIEIQP